MLSYEYQIPEYSDGTISGHYDEGVNSENCDRAFYCRILHFIKDGLNIGLVHDGVDEEGE